MVVTLLFLIYMRKNMLKKAIDLDQKALTPSDFTLYGEGITLEDMNYSPENIDKEIRQYFLASFGIEDIAYTNASYDIQQYYKYSEKYQTALKN